MQSDIESVVVKAIAAQKQLDEGLVGLDTPLEDLGINSLDAITIIYEIEEAFDVEIPNDEIEGLSNVRDIIDGVRRLLGEGG